MINRRSSPQHVIRIVTYSEIVGKDRFKIRERGMGEWGNGVCPFSYPEPFLRAVRRGALAKSKTGNHKNMVKEYIRY